MAVKNPTGRSRRQPLTGSQLLDLRHYLVEALEEDWCDGTNRRTRAFLKARGLRPAPALAWLKSYGGYCDCEVYMNVARADWM